MDNLKITITAMLTRGTLALIASLAFMLWACTKALLTVYQ